MGAGSFPGGKSGRGFMLNTHPLLVPRLRKSWAIPPLTLCFLLGLLRGSIYLYLYLYFMLFTYWLMYGLPEDDSWKIETCRWYNVLIIKPHIGIVPSDDYNTVYEIMQRMNDNNKKWGTGDKFTNFRSTILYKLKI